MKAFNVCLVVLAMGIFIANRCDGLSCVRNCYDPEVKANITCEEITCNYGEGEDICGCCPVCLKGPGEECGGPWETSGKCGEGYTCHFKDGNSNLGFNQEIGICQENDSTPSA